MIFREPGKKFPLYLMTNYEMGTCLVVEKSGETISLIRMGNTRKNFLENVPGHFPTVNFKVLESNAFTSVDFKAGAVFILAPNRLGLIVGKQSSATTFSFVAFDQYKKIKQICVDYPMINYDHCLKIGQGHVERVKFNT
jgi:hypothetical protein